ncbi:MAG: hypothetical protein V9G08_02140 [Dermatophilaceae bacterium]
MSNRLWTAARRYAAQRGAPVRPTRQLDEPPDPDLEPEDLDPDDPEPDLEPEDLDPDDPEDPEPEDPEPEDPEPEDPEPEDPEPEDPEPDDPEDPEPDDAPGEPPELEPAPGVAAAPADSDLAGDLRDEVAERESVR